MKKTGLMQPSFMPWQGLFELISNSDTFVFLDDFQFSSGSHHTRNKMFVSKGQTDYYCVPVQKSKCFEMKLNEVLIVKDSHWKNKILKRLNMLYSKTPYYNEIITILEENFNNDYKYLSDLNISIIKDICGCMGINTKFLYSSDYTKETKSTSKRSKRVLELLRWTDCDTYICAKGSYEYMKEEGLFPVKDIEVLFQNFIPKPYQQIHSSEFVGYLSIFDALFNIGPKNTYELINRTTKRWLRFEEM